jgi:hypothetical protein
VAEDNGIVDSGGGSSSSPAPSSGSDGGGSSGDSPSPGANAGESPAPTPLHVDPRCDGAGTDPMASSPTFPIHQQAAWSSAAAFDQDYSLVCYRDISVNKAKCIATKRVREGEDQLRVGTIVPGVGGAIVANSNVMAFTGKLTIYYFSKYLTREYLTPPPPPHKNRQLSLYEHTCRDLAKSRFGYHVCANKR